MIEDIINERSQRDIEIVIASLTQATLSRKSGVSYGSIKRFESKGEISLIFPN